MSDERNKIKVMHRIGIHWPNKSSDEKLQEREMPAFELIDILNGECDLCIGLEVTGSLRDEFTTLIFYVKNHESNRCTYFSEWRLLSSWYLENMVSKVVEALDRIAESAGAGTKQKAAAEWEFRKFQVYKETQK
jgi:hypothetical protein